jgi:hypothetical protein
MGAKNKGRLVSVQELRSGYLRRPMIFYNEPIHR